MSENIWRDKFTSDFFGVVKCIENQSEHLSKLNLYHIRKRATRRSRHAREPSKQNSASCYLCNPVSHWAPVSSIVVLVILRIDTCALKDRCRIHELETQEISQKPLSDALSSQWVDHLIANMPTNGTRGHIRELRNHLFPCFVKPKKTSNNYFSIQFKLTVFFGIDEI